jgi:hypothetical protein
MRERRAKVKVWFLVAQATVSVRMRFDGHAVNEFVQEAFTLHELIQSDEFIRLVRLLNVAGPAHDARNTR